MCSSNSNNQDSLMADQNDVLCNRLRATKIVATLGPASDSREKIFSLVEAGVNVFRLNFSHGTPDDHRQRAHNAREAARQLGKQVAIMADMQGPKIRVGKFEEGKINLQVNDTFILDADNTPGNQNRVGLDFPDLAKDLHVNDVLLLNDGLIILIVTAIHGSEIVTRVKVGGVLSNNKGINRQGGGLSAPALTDKDKQDILTAVALNVEFIAISFPKSAGDIQEARELVNAALKNLPSDQKFSPRLIAKIERTEAIPALDEILEASDGIMVARGDLAVEVGNARVPILQKHMISKARAANRLVITATQMMESMINYPMPTRAEVSDVANAVLDGTDAVMLSAETAAGCYPIETVMNMAHICLETEAAQKIALDPALLKRMPSILTDQSIAMGSVFNAFHLNVKAIVVLTASEITALAISRYRPHVPIFAFTSHVREASMMSAFFNITAILTREFDTNKEKLTNAINLLLEKGYVNQGDLIVTTYGETSDASIGMNTIKIITVDNKN